MRLTLAFLASLLVGLSLAQSTATAGSLKEWWRQKVGASWTGSIDVDGVSRSYCGYKPVNYQGRAVVFHFHGGLSDCTREDYTNWKEIADREGILLIMPNGLDNTWNACSAPPEVCDWPRGSSEENGVDDLGFFQLLRARIDAQFAPERVYVGGFSKGAMMALHIACHFGDSIDAVSAVAGTLTSQNCSGFAVPYLHLHGDDDGQVPWDGGGGQDWPEVWPGIAQQAALNGCSGTWSETVETAEASSYHFDGCAAETVFWRYACRHAWPGTQQVSWMTWAYPCTESFHAEEVIWSFYARH